MYYLKSRYYDPETGRFISPDNVDVLLATPTALTDKNLYLYCDNNPVMRVDEDGEFWVELGIMAVGGVIGAITNTATSYFSQKIISKEVDTSKPGTGQFKYEIKDKNGNIAAITFLAVIVTE
jgi:RHS repeat-associated protein